MICFQIKNQKDKEQSFIFPIKKTNVLRGNLIFPEGYTSSIPKALKFLIVYRIVVSYRSNRYLLGVGLQKVYCQFRFLLSSFFLLDRFIPNFGNLLNLISYRSTGYFRSYLFKFYFMYFFRNPHV